MAVVALAGPLSNVLTAALVALPLNAGIAGAECLGCLFRGGPGDVVGYALASLMYWNMLLAAFNLIPLVPLDGFKIVHGFLPREAAEQFGRLERYGPAPLLALIMIGFLVPGLNVFSTAVRPMIRTLNSILIW
jgi:Zn-dependent protease